MKDKKRVNEGKTITYDDTNRLVAGICELVLVGLDDLTGELVSPTGVVLEGPNGSSGIGSPSPSESFT